MQQAEARLLAIPPRVLRLHEETRRNFQRQVERGGGAWYFPTEEARRAAFAQLVVRLRESLAEEFP